jgi:hypothetical protein
VTVTSDKITSYEGPYLGSPDPEFKASYFYRFDLGGPAKMWKARPSLCLVRSIGFGGSPFSRHRLDGFDRCGFGCRRVLFDFAFSEPADVSDDFKRDDLAAESHWRAPIAFVRRPAVRRPEFINGRQPGVGPRLEIRAVALGILVVHDQTGKHDSPRAR